MGKAMVASAGAIEGIEADAGSHLLRADTPEQWVQAVGALLSDEPVRRQLGAAARECILERYSWDSRLAPLVTLCKRLADGTEGLS